ncbi:MAG: DUF5688 family protein [Acetatifactor sp.]
MELNEFTGKVRRAMEKEFGEEYRVELKEVRKNNGVMLHGLLIVSKERNVIPTIYLDSFWEAYEGGVTFAEIVSRLVEIYRKETCGKSINMDFFHDFRKVKDRICYRLIGRKTNEALLADVPHIDFLDLAICFFYAYSGPELGEGSILIHNSHMELWKTNTLELLEFAKKNTPRLFPGHVFSMEEMMEDILQEQKNEPLSGVEEYKEFLDAVPMKILSNEQKIQGAVCMLYEGLLEKMAAEYGKSFYILPSSVHEVILLPDKGDESEEELKNMIHDVNRTQVAPEEVLSDSLYYYDFVDKKLKFIS